MKKIIIKKTKKNKDKENRQEKIENKIHNRNEIKKYEKIFMKLPEKNLLKIAEEITHQTNLLSQTDTELIDMDNQIEAIKRVQEKKLESTPPKLKEEENEFSYYPDLNDKDFNIKIFKKKEFYENKILLPERDLDKLAEEKCNLKHFGLLPNQIFLKNFLSYNTPYNGLLIWHGTGVGKTCSAITIAEQFKKIVKRGSKKIFVLLSPSLKDNFKKQLFNADKLGKFNFQRVGDLNKKEIPQCTGNDYLNEMEDIIIENNEDLQKKINRIINSYYTFMGYDSFANYVVKLEEECIKGYPLDKKEILQKKMRKKLFSDTVIIIDEAHHIRIDGETSQKIAPPVIERVIRDADNVKLILLTATPMYNSQVEIIWLLNLLLQNDKKPIIYNNDVFDSAGDIKEGGLEILKKKSTGYISYLRSENPYSFPFRLYPDINKDKDILNSSNCPQLSMSGKEIKEENRLKYLQLINSPMKENQYEIYRKSVQNLMGIDYEEDEEIDEIQKDSGYSDIDRGLQVSNIIYPNLISDEEVSNYYGQKGFDNNFDFTLKKKNTSYKYKKNIRDKFGLFLYCPNEGEIFTGNYQLSDFSSKMDKIIKYIYNSKGIVYIYSQFITSGVLPLALALEQNGFKKYGTEQLLDIPEYSKDSDYCKSEPISYEGKRLSEYQDKKDFKQANYIIITGREDISKNNDREIYESTLADNKNGEKIKIILGSPIAGEGLDMKRIREIHILDPWHHLNRIEQVIGRGVRNCSHSDLPLKYRNCTIYQHISGGYYSDKYSEEYGRETIDIRIYRKGEQKSIKMGIIERELKKSAIDCLLNKEGNVYSISDWGEEIEIETSQQKKVKYQIGDKPYSKICNFKKNCDYQCEPQYKEILSNEEINTDTYHINFSQSQINKVINLIKDLYKKDYIFNLNDIIAHLNRNDIEIRYIYNALNILLNDDSQYVYDHLNRKGKIIYRGGYYIFQPENIKDTNIPMYYRNRPLLTKKNRISVNKNYYFKNLLEKKEKVKKTIKIKKFDYGNLQDKINQNIVSLNNDLEIYNIKQILNRDNLVQQILYDFEIDRLETQTKKDLIIYLLNRLIDIESKQEIDERLDKNEKMIFNSLNTYFLLKDRDYKGENKNLKKYILGYRIILDKDELYFCYNKNKLESCSKEKGKLFYKLKEILSKVDKREKNKIYGYIYFNMVDKKEKYSFKIVDTVKSKRSTGSLCHQINSKKYLENIINSITQLSDFYENNLTNKKINKDKICNIIEILLRYMDISKQNNLKWFYRNNLYK